MKLGSLFDGIGGWCLSAVRAGIEPVWSSEIETFPMEVTKKHFPNVTDPLTRKDYLRCPVVAQPMTGKQYVVRRLTPKECERLQDLPDGWTIVSHKSCSDSARYKALGNGMTQCVPDWILKRLVYFVNEEEKQ